MLETFKYIFENKQKNNINEKTEKNFNIDTFNKNLKTVAKNIEKHVKKQTGADIKIKNIKLEDDRLIFKSQELDTGFKLFKKLIVENFNTGPTKDGYFWVDVHYTWENYSGGTNGTKISDIFFTEDGKIYLTRDEIK